MWWSSIVGSLIGASAALLAVYIAQRLNIRNRQATERLNLSTTLKTQAADLYREIEASPNWKDWRSIHNITETLNHMEAACVSFPQSQRKEVWALIDETHWVLGSLTTRSQRRSGGGMSDDDWTGLYRWVVLVSFAVLGDMNRGIEPEVMVAAMTFYDVNGLSANRPGGPVMRVPLNAGLWRRFKDAMGIDFS